jgi:hypothetical protein
MGEVLVSAGVIRGWRLWLLVLSFVTSGGASLAHGQTPPTDTTLAADTDAAEADSVHLADSAVAVAVPTSTCGRNNAEVQARRVAAGAVFVGGNALLYRYFKRAWWSGTKADHFFFRSDWDEDFRDQDKFGHMHGGYHLARIGDAVLRDACMSRSHALWWSAAYATVFQLQIEIWDGRFEKYGFSYPDLLANTLGMVWAVAQQKNPPLRAVKPTISYARTAAMRNARNIPGELRPSLDYSGQTYWISADIDAMLPGDAKPYWPGFLRVSAGHSITDWIDARTGANMRAKRKILLTIDFDPEKLPGDNPIWKTFKRNLSYIHLPSPALQLTPNFELLKWYR